MASQRSCGSGAQQPFSTFETMLKGVRILDLSRLLPGPAATWMMHGMGATVDRVEAIGGGDFARHIPPKVPVSSAPGAEKVGAVYAFNSRGKRSLALDFHSSRGRDLVRKLSGKYDVVVESFKPGVMEDMGLSPATLIQDHPALIVARISAWGQDGPWRTQPAHDLNCTGVAGVVSAAATTCDATGGVALPPVQIADLSAAQSAVMGVCAALYSREKTGKGTVLDVSMLESTLACYAPHILMHTAAGRNPRAGDEILSGGDPMYGTYKCSDGKLITVGAVEPKFQAMVLEATGLAQHAGERAKPVRVTREQLSEKFMTKTAGAWVSLLQGACVGPAVDVDEIHASPQVAGRGSVQHIDGASWVLPPFADRGVSLSSIGDVPSLGQHSRDILLDNGWSLEEVQALQHDGIVGGV